uniref:Glycosyltransferase n=1 Tax=Araucaria cunninghamii TaxID=56994 RepID=A0A0D6QS53_ARACU
MGSLGPVQYIKPHVVVLPYPAQGHVNPMMEFSKRLASKNIHVTFVITEASRARMLQAQGSVLASPLPDIQFETISDGLPVDFDRHKDVQRVLGLLQTVGGQTFEELIHRLEGEGESVSCIVYDSFLPWVPEIAKKLNIPSAFFWTQSCAVYSIYYHYSQGLEKKENQTGNATDEISIPGLPPLRTSDLPSFLQPSNTYEFLERLVLDQFNTVSEATWLLGNSFEQLEAGEIKSIESLLPIRTVGPLVPSAFLDGNNPQDTDVGMHMWKAANCLGWLDTKGQSSVIYVSFGSLAVLSKEQIWEIALGLRASGHSFLWVIRPGENKAENNIEEHLPEKFLEETAEQGLVVAWCPQMKVLSHPSVSVFMTHCGWNSTLESLSSGVPLLAVPQWSDQTTNSKYVEDKWKTGIRLKKREDGLLGREEVENSIRTVMESERGIELRKNALRWKSLAREAMVKGGSSDKNIEDFVEEIIARASSMSPSVIV